MLAGYVLISNLSCPHTVITIHEATTYLGWSVTSSTPWRPRFNSMMVFMGFVVGSVATGQVSFTVLQFSSANYHITVAVHVHSSFIIRSWHNTPRYNHTATANMCLCCCNSTLPACLYLKRLQYSTKDFQHPIQWRDKIIFNYKYVIITEL